MTTRFNKTMMGFSLLEPPDEHEAFPLDPDPLGELKTEPLPQAIPTEPPPSAVERSTERPTLNELARLVAESSSVPTFCFDVEKHRWILAEPFTACQVDQWGNTYVVPCRRGLEVNIISMLSEPLANRSECVRRALQEDRSIATIFMKGARSPTQIGRLNDQMLEDIVQTFYQGDKVVPLESLQSS